MLTARDAVEDRVAGLDAGADDYLTKPFSFAELLARLRALARRGPVERPAVLEVGDLRLDPATRQVWRGEAEIELSAKEFALLETFMRRPGEVLSRFQLLEHAWDYEYENRSNVVDVYVRYLREKIDRPFGCDVDRDRARRRLPAAPRRRQIVIGSTLASGALLASLGSQAEELVRSAGYVGLTVVMVIENVFPPIPSELVLPLAGYEVSRGELNFVGALLAATLGSLIGAWVIYAIGRVGGRPLVARLHPLLRVSAEDLDRAERWFQRRGDWVVLGARMVPGARSVVSVPAGMLEMPLLRFSVLTALGSLVWNAVLIAAGNALGANWEQIGSIVGPASTVILVLGGLVAIALLVSWRRKVATRASAGG